MKKLFFLILFLLLPVSLFSDFMVDSIIDYSPPKHEQELKLYISTVKAYFVIGDSIPVSFKIKNISDKEIELNIQPAAYDSFKIYIYDDLNSQKKCRHWCVDANNRLKMEQNKPELFEYRSIVLYPGESFSVNIDLSKWYDIDNPGYYKIYANFFPESQINNKEFKIISNILNLIVRPSDKMVRIKQKRLMEQKRKEEILSTPEGTINNMLFAKKNKLWEDYFKCLDIDSVIVNYKEFKHKYENTAQDYKYRVIDNFKNWYKKSNDSHIINYKIKGILFSDNQNIRDIITEEYLGPKTYPGTYQYTYRLIRKGKRWFVSSINATVIKK